jgi:myxalamid-type polyketide synthase MxaB
MVNQNPLENEKQPATTSTRPADHGALLRQALRAVEQMQQRVEASESSAKRLAHQPIAVVGIGCRFPGGANDTASFWQLLREGREAIREVPQDRWKIDDFYDPDPATPGKMVSRFGGFLDEIDKFDAGYFGIAPREAAMMDPQQRLLLEVTIQALESGAIPPSSLAGTQTGVYLGMASGDYGQLQIQHGDSSLLDMHFASGNAHSIASGRLAYLLGFKGPGVTLDTACSSSLVAVHLACQALRTGDCSVAIAGGVNIILLPETTVALSHAHMLSPDGRSKAFDARADGFARAEGCGIVVLKSLAQAESDGDRIFAVIRGSAVNQDGASSSLTAPNGPSQEALMRAALQDAGIGSGINASSIGYIEAHGTGTALGDPIELRALGAVYGTARRSSEPVLVGSLKTNFGHMEAAAGVGGLIKLILALEHAEIPPHATIQTPTPHVPWPQLRLGIPRSVEPWPTSLAAGGQEPPRTGVVSSFGFSGTNAHLIVEQAPQGNGGGSPQPGEQIGRILPLSAKSAPALDRLVVRYEAALAPSAQASAWADFAATAGEGRDHFPYRLAVVASNCQEATGLLQRYRAESRPNVATKTRNLAFLFTGQGSERSGMGLGLLQASRVFRSAIERLDGAVGSTLGTSIATIWANESGELERASLVQPAIYAYGWALSELWRNWGVVPRVVLGHSLGEYVAATVAGVLSPEEGIRLVAARGRLTEELARAGGMLAVVADRETVQSIVGDIEGIAFAAINGPSSVVLSGKLEAIELCENRLKIHELRFKRLRTTHGFHSETLDGMLQAFEAEASHVAWNVPEIRWISNLTGRPVERSQPVDASYWRSQLRETVQFQMVLESAGSSGADLYLELGTEPQLLALAEANGIDSERCIASLRKGGLTGEFSKLLQAAASLYMAGVDLDWRSIHRDHPSVNEPARKVALPGYPFERQRFWFTESAGSRRGQATPSSVTSNHPLLATRLRISSKQTIFQSTVSPQQPAYLGDHILGGMRILPGAAYLEMAIAACRHEGADKHWRAVDFEFREPCLFDEPRLLEAVLYPTEDKTNRRRFEVASTEIEAAPGQSAADTEWRLHAVGYLESVPVSSLSGEVLPSVNISLAQEGVSIHWSREDFYGRLANAGVGFGPAFQPVAQAWGSADQSLVELDVLPAVLASASQYGIHPVVLDACMQAVAALVESDEPSAPALPAAVESFELWGNPSELRFARATVRKRQARSVTVDVLGLDAGGSAVLMLKGLTLVTTSGSVEDSGYSGWLHEVVWEQAQLEASTLSHQQVVILTREAAPAYSELARLMESVATHGGAAVTLIQTGAADGEEQLAQWLASSQGGESQPATREIIYLPGAEIAPLNCKASSQEALAWQEEVLGGILRWTQFLLELDRLQECKLWLVSRGAAGLKPAAPEGATLASFARSLRSEYSGAKVTAVDLDHAEGREPDLLSSDTMAAVAAEDAERLWHLISSSGEPAAQYFLKGDSVQVPRLKQSLLKPSESANNQPSTSTRRLRFPGTGLLEDLHATEEPRREPQTSEIEIEICSAALNFHEVLSALDPDHEVEITPGGECSGVIVRIGSEVRDFQIGDEVVATSSGLLAEYATMTQNRVWKKPPGISMEDAATLIIPFLTARWSLEYSARLKPGESILIHAGAGGVGLAAIQEAKRLGARVFATAGSEAKRTYLLQLGVEAVADSRSTSFEKAILDATGGRGVDVVLNSLAGDKIPASMRLLVPGGRFIELGLATILDPAQVTAIRPDIRYEVIHVRTPLGNATPEVCATIAAILRDVESGILHPLPWHQFSLDEASEAFRFMAAGLHTGRVLLAPARAQSSPVPQFPGFRADGAYLVTGGLAGLGLEVVEWIATQGAGLILALGRSEPTQEVHQRLNRLRQLGVVIHTRSCDVSEETSVAAAIASLPDAYDLRGVFHCAGVWDNGAIANQDWAKYRNALSGKLVGAWNLHRLTQAMPLDCFVMFSSIAGMMGSRGQSNYAAANAYLDALAHFRRVHMGLPALSVDWGAWSEVGAAVRHGMTQRSAHTGAEPIAPVRGLALLLRLLQGDFTQVLAARIDWKKWAEYWPAETAANRDLLAGLLSPIGTAAATSSSAEADSVSGASWMAQLLAIPPARKKAYLASRVESRIRTVLSLGNDQTIDPARPLQEYGLDSLLSIELRNSLSADLSTKLSATALFDYPTMGGLTNWLFDDVLKLKAQDDNEEQAGSHPVVEVATTRAKDLVADVASLSDEEVDRLFQEKMAGTRQ